MDNGMMEVGKLYTAVNGFEYLCLFERDGEFYCSLVDDKGKAFSAAYRWDKWGLSLDMERRGFDFV